LKITTQKGDPETMKIRRSLVALCGIGVLALTALAGCGGGNDNTTSTSASTPAPAAPAPAGAAKAATSTVNVSETEYKLTPSDPTVKKGEVTINAKNNGQVQHSIEVEGPGGEQRLNTPLNPGQSGTLKVSLTKPGKYTWYCPIDGHKNMGMKGEITVK
jgi:uncharacterized cupredoxin-like copper-binding protein